jgi:hypothetical protein
MNHIKGRVECPLFQDLNAFTRDAEIWIEGIRFCLSGPGR